MLNVSISKENGGRGLIQLRLTYKTTTIRLNQYSDTTRDWMLQLVDTREVKEKYSISKENNKFAKQLNLTL